MVRGVMGWVGALGALAMTLIGGSGQAQPAGTQGPSFSVSFPAAASDKPLANRVAGPLIPAAPADLVAALGALDRKLYVVPSLKLVVVRMGAATPDRGFDQQLWLRLMKAIAA